MVTTRSPRCTSSSTCGRVARKAPCSTSTGSTGPANALYGVTTGSSADSETEIWIVGENGTLARYDGSTWTSFKSPTDKTLYAVWGSGGDVWAVGDEVVIRFHP